MAAIITVEAPQQQGDSEALFEIVDGERVDLPPMSILANRVASKLHVKLGQFAEANTLGEALMEALLHLPPPVDRHRRVDVAFASAQAIGRAPPQLGSEDAWDLVPELMVEVVSPTDLADEIMERVDEYFRAGTKLMWVIFPTQRLIHVYASPRQVRMLGVADELDGGSVLPGFRIPVALLFPEK